jgi:hypothetical protein
VILSHKPLSDSVVEQELFRLLGLVSSDQVSLDSWSTNTYVDSFIRWIQAGTYNQIHGLDGFDYFAYGHGAIEGIEEFINRHSRHRRIRFSQAEFIIDKIICNSVGANFLHLESGPIEPNDAVLVSLPFAGNGGIYPGYNDMIVQCSQLNVPVLLDLAYYGISHGMNIDLTHSCITDVIFSLSKPMITQLRLGLRLTRKYYDDVLQTNSDLKIYNRISTFVGVQLMEKFPCDYIISKYLDKQINICNNLGITPTATVTLAIGNEKNHNDFYRNGIYRICITDELLERL